MVMMRRRFELTKSTYEKKYEKIIHTLLFSYLVTVHSSQIFMKSLLRTD
jgi:hypothetical protein